MDDITTIMAINKANIMAYLELLGSSKNICSLRLIPFSISKSVALGIFRGLSAFLRYGYEVEEYLLTALFGQYFGVLKGLLLVPPFVPKYFDDDEDFFSSSLYFFFDLYFLLLELDLELEDLE